MRKGDAFIGVDWGTTNRRAYRIDANGVVSARLGDGRGVLSVPPGGFPDEVAALRAQLGDLPVVAAGMVGSSRGWIDVPYVDAPTTLAALAAGTVQVTSGVGIVPGVALRDARYPDVMRGEEVQVLGAIAAGLAPGDALFCQPGTHNKWITVRHGAITGFATAMTGELFALVRDHGILQGMLDGPVGDGPAFRAGLARAAGAVDLAAALFGVRASVLVGGRPAEEAAAYASGILIGSDVGARGDVAGADVHLLASGPLAALYASAIDASGGRAVPVDAEAAFLAGISRIRHAIGG